MGGRPMRWRFVAATLAVVLLAGCQVNTAHTTVSGSGTLATATRTVSGFDAVTLNGFGALTITQGSTESLTIEAEDNLLPWLKSTVSGQRLTLGPEERTTIVPTRSVTYTLTVKNLRALELAGAGSITATGLATNALTVTLNGGGTITLAGRADAQTATISGAGTYHAEDLASKAVTITFNGAGLAVVQASDTLKATVNGAATIEYSGNPTVTKDINGAGIVRQR